MATDSVPADFPPAEILQTGDLLFPRAANVKVPFVRPVESFTMDDATFQTATQRQFEGGTDSDPERDLFRVGSDPAHEWLRLAAVYKVLDRLFPEIAAEWAGRGLAIFLKHPLLKLFLSAFAQEFSDNMLLGDGTLGNYYIGHVAMVVRESKDKDRLFVIEANASDFSHYRVAIHLYHDPATANLPLGLRRGWVDRRTGKSQLVWACRHRLLDDSSVLAPAERDGARDRLANTAKKYLGRPYGMFDILKFGDDDRLYCGEFCHRAYADAFAGSPHQARLDDNRSWKWLADNFNIPLPQPLLELLLRLYGEFPWLTVKMLNKSAHLKAIHQPRNLSYA
jgi:hypothetical protein